MKLLGLNSPEIFIILVILFSILGPKRLEKGSLLLKKLFKFLLSEKIYFKFTLELTINKNFMFYNY